METIHLKTVDPVSQDLLRTAAQKGINLNWERYEKLQPQDGFLRLGLSCPYGCLQGPCRIDPFGRGPQEGLCGMGKDQMVGALILRMALQGVLESCNGEVPDGSIPKDGVTSHAQGRFGAAPVSMQDIYQSSLHLGSGHVLADDILVLALRLGLLALELNAGDTISPDTGICKAGYGVMAGNGKVIGVSGNPPPDFLKSVHAAMTESASSTVQMVSLGDWIRVDEQYLPIACTTGEAELLASSGSVDLLVYGPGTEPGLLARCRELAIPAIQDGESTGTDAVVKSAVSENGKTRETGFTPDPSHAGEGHIVGTDQLKECFAKMGDESIALVGGADTPHLSLGWVPVELSKGLLGDDIGVATWGDAAVWMIKDGMASKENQTAPLILDPCKGPIQAVSALQSTDKLGNLKGVCFTGLNTCRDFSVALGLAGIGLDVCVTTPLPVWGSESIRNRLDKMLSNTGGSLHHFDHSPHAQEVLDWFADN